MAVETAGLTTLVAIVSLLAVGVIGDDEGVLVLGTDGVSGDTRADIFATVVDLRHVILLQEGSVVLLRVVTIESRSCGCSEVLGSVRVLCKE